MIELTTDKKQPKKKAKVKARAKVPAKAKPKRRTPMTAREEKDFENMIVKVDQLEEKNHDLEVKVCDLVAEVQELKDEAELRRDLHVPKPQNARNSRNRGRR